MYTHDVCVCVCVRACACMCEFKGNALRIDLCSQPLISVRRRLPKFRTCEIMLRIRETIWSLALYNYHRNCCERCNPPDNCLSNFAYLQSCAQKASICANYAYARKLCTSHIRLVHVPYTLHTSFILKICACLQAPLNRTNVSSGARRHSMKLFHRIYD